MTAPVINITNVTKYKISKITGHNISVVNFTSNQDLFAWEARADGYSVGTGSLVGNASGSSTSSPNGYNMIYGRLRYGNIIASASASGSSKTAILKAGEIGTFEVDDTELTSGDKQYRITVYGQNMSGEWSSYEQLL